MNQILALGQIMNGRNHSNEFWIIYQFHGRWKERGGDEDDANEKEFASLKN